MARPKIISVLDDKYINPGENVTLNCTVTGNPQPQIHWVLDGQNILDDADQVHSFDFGFVLWCAP